MVAAEDLRASTGAPPGLEPSGRAAEDRASRRVAGRGHARVGLGRLDRQGRERLHPRQRRRRRPPARRRGAALRGRLVGRRTDEAVVEDDTEGDLCGHGTACAGIVRSLAPDCELVSVRVLGAGFTGSGGVLLAGLRWAVEQGFDVINMSLSTTKRQFAGILHELTDTAYFHRTVLVASAHNMPVESYPWRFSSVISVGSHEESRPAHLLLQPRSAGGVLRARRRRRGRLDRAAPASAARATASRRRTCPGSARSCSASIRS